MTSRGFAFGVLGSEWVINGLLGLSSSTGSSPLSSAEVLASWSFVCTGVFGVSTLQTGLADGGGVVRRGGTWFVRDGGGEAGALPIFDVRFSAEARGSSGSSSSEATQKGFSSTTFPDVLGAVEGPFGLKRTRATDSVNVSSSSSDSDTRGSRLTRFLSLAVRGGVGSDAVDAERLRPRRGGTGGGGW